MESLKVDDGHIRNSVHSMVIFYDAYAIEWCERGEEENWSKNGSNDFWMPEGTNMIKPKGVFYLFAKTSLLLNL